MPRVELTDEEADALFEHALVLANSWKERKLLFSGYDVYIANDGRLSLRPLELPDQYPGEVKDLNELAQYVLGHHQRVRHFLGEHFNLRATLWNHLHIARMMERIENYLRREANLLDDSTKGQRGDYNVLSLVFLLNEIRELNTLVASPAFTRAWKWKKFRMLTKHAKGFFERNKSRSMRQMMSLQAEIILAFPKLEKSMGAPMVRPIIRDCMRSGFVSSLENYFGTCTI